MTSFEAWHTRGHSPCGNLAWTFVKHPSELRYAMTSANVLMPNGAKPEPFSKIECGSCCKTVGQPSLELREVEGAG